MSATALRGGQPPPFETEDIDMGAGCALAAAVALAILAGIFGRSRKGWCGTTTDGYGPK